MRAPFCIKCGYDLTGHAAAGGESWECPECGIEMTAARLERAVRRARRAAWLAPALVLITGILMAWSLSLPDEDPWTKIRQSIEAIVGDIQIPRRAYEVIMLLAPVMWIAFSLLVLWMGARAMRAAGWRRRPRALVAVGIVFLILASICWELYVLFAMAMSRYQP